MIRLLETLSFFQTNDVAQTVTQPIRVITQSSDSGSGPVVIGFTTAFTLLSGVILVLWRKVDAENKRSSQREVDCSNARIADQKEWHAKFETLQKEQSASAQKMIDQLVKVIERSKETEYATVSAITDNSKSSLSVAQAITSLTQKLNERVQP